MMRIMKIPFRTLQKGAVLGLVLWKNPNYQAVEEARREEIGGWKRCKNIPLEIAQQFLALLEVKKSQEDQKIVKFNEIFFSGKGHKGHQGRVNKLSLKRGRPKGAGNKKNRP